MSNNIELEIVERSPFAAGYEFDRTGPYERLIGRAHFVVDPTAMAQSVIVDIDKAPVNGDGLVEFSADICLLTPAVPSRGNRRILFGYGNRGNKRELQFFNDAPACNDPKTLADAGNGYLMRRGYTIVWGAWQGDLLAGDGRMLLNVPVATDGGHPITGLVRTEFFANQPGVTMLPLSGQASTRSHPTVSLDTTHAQLTKRRYAHDPRIAVPPDAWSFSRVEAGEGLDGLGTQRAVTPSHTHIYFPGGFEPGWLYELVYTARDPLVLGLGHVAVRDLVSFLKYEVKDGAGNPNPLAGNIEKAYAWGRSQSGRCIRDFVYYGFNEDGAGRRVFDGVLSHVAGAGLMWMNQRFANMISRAGQQLEDHFSPADRFPFSYAECTDHITGRTDAILKRPNTDPAVIHTQTATEYWQRRGSLVHTDTRGNDLTQPDNVRIYLWSSSQHFADPRLEAPTLGVHRNLSNVVHTSMLFRAMLDAMDRWVTDGVQPPESQIPRKSDASLVTMDEWRRQFPTIPGVASPRAPNSLEKIDFGPDFEKGLLSKEPPDVIAEQEYSVLVPEVDADGNDVAGVRAPMVQAPLGTYTGWNIRSRGFGNGALYELTGSYIPFPETPEERRMIGDPRPSILERYQNAQGYVQRIEAAARTLVQEGLMLEEDIERAVEAAADWSRPRHDVRI